MLFMRRILQHRPGEPQHSVRKCTAFSKQEGGLHSAGESAAKSGFYEQVTSVKWFLFFPS